jgi:outer membrane receptor for ferrienterochelin and colicins
LLLSCLVSATASAQEGRPADTTFAIRVHVHHAQQPIPGAVVRAVATPRSAVQTDAEGNALLHLPEGVHLLVATRIGFRPDSVRLTLPAGESVTLRIELQPQHAELDAVVVSATRGDRRVEDTPLRVEVIDEEELGEKITMRPGSIAMMLAETSGLSVQSTNPSLGGASVRIQGLRGRYSLLLADGLPLHGGQAGGLGLLQIPPLDLGHVEIIKGASSALYGSAALGGVINLVSRRPGEERSSTVLVNGTTRGGQDVILFDSAPLGERAGYTLLAGAHAQSQRDLDGDGWTDLAGYQRLVVRPRLHLREQGGLSAFLTAGVTAEDREGGTLPGREVPTGGAFMESLRTRKVDVGGLARWAPGAGNEDREGALASSLITVRASATELRHDHRFGSVREDDRHRTIFTEATLAIARVHGDRSATYILGAALQHDRYRNPSVPAFEHEYSVPAALAQVDVDLAHWLSASGSARLDAHNEFGSYLNPRLSVLLRGAERGWLSGWTTRLSYGTGASAPTPFTEETEATGLTPLMGDGGLTSLTMERARSGSIDAGRLIETAIGRLEVNATLFASRVRHPLQIREGVGLTPEGARRIALANAPQPTRSWGSEFLARLVRELGDDDGDEEPPTLRITAAWTWLRSTECDPNSYPDAGSTTCTRREVPLTPRHAIGVVASVEREDRDRIGIEVYHTGTQMLDDNPYRTVGRPHVTVGLLAERAFITGLGVARVFVNLENLTNVRQTRFDPLLRPERGSGGRWTTDAWTHLDGFVANAGVRLTYRRAPTHRPARPQRRTDRHELSVRRTPRTGIPSKSVCSVLPDSQ